MRQIALTLVLSLTPTAAFAYFDPGTGSLLIQAAIGAVAFLLVMWRNLVAYIRSLFSKRERDLSASDSQSNDASDESR